MQVRIADFFTTFASAAAESQLLALSDGLTLRHRDLGKMAVADCHTARVAYQHIFAEFRFLRVVNFGDHAGPLRQHRRADCGSHINPGVSRVWVPRRAPVEPRLGPAVSCYRVS